MQISGRGLLQVTWRLAGEGGLAGSGAVAVTGAGGAARRGGGAASPAVPPERGGRAVEHAATRIATKSPPDNLVDRADTTASIADRPGARPLDTPDAWG